MRTFVKKTLLIIFFIILGQVPKEIYGQERLSHSQGTVYDTTVNTDHVNIHRYPSLQSEMLFQVSNNTRITILGTSKNVDTIDGYTGHWLMITVMEGQPNQRREGWIFSRFVNNGNIIPNELRIVKLGTLISQRRPERRLIGTFMNGDTEVQFTVRAMQWENQPFWTFVWNHTFDDYGVGNENFRFDTVPGTYVWFQDAGELRHISHIGGFPESGESGLWDTMFTDDLKFIIRKIAGMGWSRVNAWEVASGTVVFEGQYSNPFRLNGYTIGIYFYIFNNQLDEMDDELRVFVKDFLTNHPEPTSEDEPYANIVAVFAEYDLDTRVTRIINARWVYRM